MIILALIAIGILFSIMLTIFDEDLPGWFRRFEYWELFGLLIGLAIVCYIIYLVSISKEKKH
jgi:hypothetical protein